MFDQNMGAFAPNQPQYNSPDIRMSGYNQFVPSTNKSFVRSLEEALSLPAHLNSQNVYFDVNNDVMYDICTNGRGEKSWAIFDIALRQTSSGKMPNSVIAGTADSDARLKSLETKFASMENKLEALINGKYNAEQTDSTNAGSV